MDVRDRPSGRRPNECLKLTGAAIPVAGKNIFTFTDYGCKRLWGHVPDEPPRVLFGHAGDPESLESATVKAAWLDECGQAGFRLASYETILGRLPSTRAAF